MDVQHHLLTEGNGLGEPHPQPSTSPTPDHEASIQASTLSTSPSHLHNVTRPQLPPGFLRLLDELYPDNEGYISNAPEVDFDFGPQLDFTQLTDQFFPEMVNQILDMAALQEWPADF